MKLDTPIFVRLPKFVSWNAEGKVLWGGPTFESVLTDDPDGPAVFVAERIGLYELGPAKRLDTGKDA